MLRLLVKEIDGGRLLENDDEIGGCSRFAAESAGGGMSFASGCCAVTAGRLMQLSLCGCCCCSLAAEGDPWLGLRLCLVAEFPVPVILRLVNAGTWIRCEDNSNIPTQI